MTDVVGLAKRLYDRIEWQTVLEQVEVESLVTFIVEAIKYLYVLTGRSEQFRDDMFTVEGELVVTFSEDLALDEQEYVLITAEIAFFKKVQTSVNHLTSYTTNALSVTHGDKPFANIQQRQTDLAADQRVVWYKMIRYNML